jgi:two-component system chemotaxis response regulator CheY
MKLLIVDDSLVIRNKINRGLLKRFDRVLRAENGLQALKLVKAERPDVVTMDLTMPRMDGVECIKEITQILPNTYILVVSALTDKATAIAALSHGANGFLCKPFTEAQLSSAISKILQMKLSA